MQNYAIVVHQFGGPEQLRVEAIPMPEPGEGQVLVRNTAIGLNFADTYHRTGLYPLPLPLIPGGEAAGIVEKVGQNVSAFKSGDRVAYVDPAGAYCHWLLRPQDRLIKIPDDITDEVAAASLAKGITVHYLIHTIHDVKAGETILVHAAAGGVGQILCQWSKHKGAIVIGTVGSEHKIAIAREAGCDHVINMADTPVVSAQVRAITSGRGVSVVYDGIGKLTFMDSLDCLAPRGLMVSYGNASGVVEPFSLLELAKRGSLCVTRPTSYMADADELKYRAAEVFNAIRNGWMKISITGRYPLTEAATAHANLEARKTTGSTVMIP